MQKMQGTLDKLVDITSSSCAPTHPIHNTTNTTNTINVTINQFGEEKEDISHLSNPDLDKIIYRTNPLFFLHSDV